MRVEELRIGSILNYKGKSFKILEISQSRLKAQSNKGLVLFEVSELEPIELTEEILLKCGFVKCSYRDNHYNVLGMVIWNCNEMFICNKNGVQLKYLHQLQNLHYCLVGYDLNVNM